MNFEALIQEIYQEVKLSVDQGQVATYIPQLATVDAEKFGVYLTSKEGSGYGVGDCYTDFSIQSIAKVLALSLAYKLVGENLWTRLGVEPSGTAFNSLVQLEADQGKPRNPFINAGALVISDVLLTQLQHPKEDFLDFVRSLSDNKALSYSIHIAESEKSVGFRNVALCNLIKSYGNLDNDPEEVLDFYFNLCSIEMNCQALSELFFFLANNGNKIGTEEALLTQSEAKRINAIMQTCGFYDESGEFAFKVGLPGKSGVGGGIIAVHPNQYAIAVWSPRLNSKGNSLKGMKFLEAFTTRSKLSIF